MTRGHGISGSVPVLTAEQRERVGAIIRRRNEIRAAIKALEVEFDSLPTNTELVAEFGVCVQTLHKCAHHVYRFPNPLDRVPALTPNNPEPQS